MRGIGWRRQGCEVRGPWQAKTRTAILSPWFEVRGGGRVLEDSSLPTLERYRPAALAGPVGTLRGVARRVLASPGARLPLEYGVLAFTALGRPALETEDRDLFWKAFRVPVFEQCRRWDGELYAEECVAHRGLHLRIATDPPNSAEALLLDERCECGDVAPRVAAVPRLVELPLRVLAMSA